jgi:hypothetical protein
MKYYKFVLYGLILFMVMFYSCEPRIDFEQGQWGDHAYITGVLIFKLEEEEHKLQEYYESGATTTGIRRVFLNTSSDIDNENARVVVTVPSNIDLTNVGLVIRHEAVKVEPLDESPLAGYLNDFSNGPYSYRLTSADGTVRDWIIEFILN